MSGLDKQKNSHSKDDLTITFSNPSTSVLSDRICLIVKENSQSIEVSRVRDLYRDKYGSQFYWLPKNFPLWRFIDEYCPDLYLYRRKSIFPRAVIEKLSKTRPTNLSELHNLLSDIDRMSPDILQLTQKQGFLKNFYSTISKDDLFPTKFEHFNVDSWSQVFTASWYELLVNCQEWLMNPEVAITQPSEPKNSESSSSTIPQKRPAAVSSAAPLAQKVASSSSSSTTSKNLSNEVPTPVHSNATTIYPPVRLPTNGSMVTTSSNNLTTSQSKPTPGPSQSVMPRNEVGTPNKITPLSNQTASTQSTQADATTTTTSQPSPNITSASNNSKTGVTPQNVTATPQTKPATTSAPLRSLVGVSSVSNTSADTTKPVNTGKTSIQPKANTQLASSPLQSKSATASVISPPPRSSATASNTVIATTQIEKPNITPNNQSLGVTSHSKPISTISATTSQLLTSVTPNRISITAPKQSGGAPASIPSKPVTSATPASKPTNTSVQAKSTKVNIPQPTPTTLSSSNDPTSQPNRPSSLEIENDHQSKYTNLLNRESIRSTTSNNPIGSDVVATPNLLPKSNMINDSSASNPTKATKSLSTPLEKTLLTSHSLPAPKKPFHDLPVQALQTNAVTTSPSTPHQPQTTKSSEKGSCKGSNTHESVQVKRNAEPITSFEAMYIYENHASIEHKVATQLNETPCKIQ
ncbi:hypothetical protein K7432_003707 [Basidiobolus ranarum]|uniref:Uncharacterized protein n=1 Tax=Basidiobolus ranarum TaxID=34480 RepID=A0ABR2WZI0_9FUNG